MNPQQKWALKLNITENEIQKEKRRWVVGENQWKLRNRSVIRKKEKSEKGLLANIKVTDGKINTSERGCVVLC